VRRAGMAAGCSPAVPRPRHRRCFRRRQQGGRLVRDQRNRSGRQQGLPLAGPGPPMAARPSAGRGGRSRRGPRAAAGGVAEPPGKAGPEQTMCTSGRFLSRSMTRGGWPARAVGRSGGRETPLRGGHAKMGVDGGTERGQESIPGVKEVVHRGAEAGRAGKAISESEVARHFRRQSSTTSRVWSGMYCQYWTGGGGRRRAGAA
jgi:hypothetical protein